MIGWPLDGEPKRAAPFDLDGLLIDSESVQTQAWRAALSIVGVADSVHIDWVSYMDRKVTASSRELAERFQLSEAPEGLVKARQRTLLQLQRRMGRPTPGAERPWPGLRVKDWRLVWPLRHTVPTLRRVWISYA